MKRVVSHNYHIIYYNTLDELKDSVSFLHQKEYIWCTGKKEEPLLAKMCPGMLIINPEKGQNSWLTGESFCWCLVSKGKIFLDIGETDNNKIINYLQKQYPHSFSRYQFTVIKIKNNLRQITNQIVKELI